MWLEPATRTRERAPTRTRPMPLAAMTEICAPTVMFVGKVHAKVIRSIALPTVTPATKGNASHRMALARKSR